MMRRSLRRSVGRQTTALAVILPAVLAGPVSGQALKEGNAAEAPRLAPGGQRAAFALPEGFSIELVTSEEQGVEKPVALHFDGSGEGAAAGHRR